MWRSEVNQVTSAFKLSVISKYLLYFSEDDYGNSRSIKIHFDAKISCLFPQFFTAFWTHFFLSISLSVLWCSVQYTGIINGTRRFWWKGYLSVFTSWLWVEFLERIFTQILFICSTIVSIMLCLEDGFCYCLQYLPLLIKVIKWTKSGLGRKWREKRFDFRSVNKVLSKTWKWFG